MTPYDILRALALELGNDIQGECLDAQTAISTVFQLADLNFDGKISFPEFIFFIKLLSSKPSSSVYSLCLKTKKHA